MIGGCKYLVANDVSTTRGVSCPFISVVSSATRCAEILAPIFALILFPRLTLRLLGQMILQQFSFTLLRTYMSKFTMLQKKMCHDEGRYRVASRDSFILFSVCRRNRQGAARPSGAARWQLFVGGIFPYSCNQK